MNLSTQLAILAIFLGSIAAVAFADCSISNETTIWGGNERVVVKESKAVALLHGRVVQNSDQQEPWGDILVEVYEHPEAVLRGWPSSQMDRKRIVGCKTDVMGAFSFKLKPGDYEVRFSCCTGVNVTSMVLKVRKGLFVSRRALTVHLTPGT